MIARPSGARAAPRMKSICPPTPEYRRCPIESATTWPVRSTSIAELIATIRRNERMTCGSLVKSTERISTIGLSSTKSYSRWVPIRNAVTILPRLRSLRIPLTTPASTRSTTASVNISVWIPRSCLPWRARAVAAGIAPIPSWSVAPSGTSSATWLADAALHLADLAGRVLVRGLVDLDGEVDVVHVDEALAQGPRHRPVELHDHRGRGADGRVHRLHAGAQRAEAVRVGRGGVDQDDVQRDRAGVEEVRDVRQEDRHVVGPALVDGRAGVRPDEQGPMAEVAGHLRGEVRTGPLDVEMHHPDVVQLGCTRHQGVEQHGRGRRRAVDVDLVAGAHGGDRLRC